MENAKLKQKKNEITDEDLDQIEEALRLYDVGVKTGNQSLDVLIQDKMLYCKSRNNGGPACSLCEYEKNENGTELDNIICKYCPKNAVLSKDNKCYYCDEELGKGCNMSIFL